MNVMKRQKTYRTLNQCIYCGESRNPRKLTLEHIVPEALGGGLKFERASCNQCQRSIERFEGRLINNMFAGVRALLGISSKRSKPRLNLKLNRLNFDGSTATQVYSHKKDQPGHFVLDGLRIPRFQINLNTPYPSPRRIRVVVKNITDNPFSQSYVVLQDLISEYPDFTRLLAKIAHSYWIAENGADGLYPVLPDFILGKTEFQHDYFVGRNEGFNSFIDDLHFLKTGQEIKGEFVYGYVDIALFSCFPVFNGYRVYVGSIGKKMEFYFR